MSCVAVVGLGYVGLPLAVAFGQKMRTIGFDVSEEKVMICKKGRDPSRELSDEEVSSANQAIFTSDPSDLALADFIIVAVPTPVDEAHIPDFRPLVSASISVGRNMQPGAIVVYESTVYPGATEEVCIPVLERESRMRWKTDFFVGYSPERINPGDKEHTLKNILKVVSGDTPETLESVAELYTKIICPGVYRASSIKTAEAAKVIENTQRDLNIALMNELSIIFNKIGIDTADVLKAAGTKWNFLSFKPGLVGGHCIGVDPYYLTHKAEMLGYHPQVITAGRRINDSMGKFIAEQTVKQMIAGGSHVKGAKVNVLGLTFKENCGDLRNSKVIDIISELTSFGIQVFVADPQAKPEEALVEYGISLCPWSDLPCADAVVAAVSHDEFSSLVKSDLSKKLISGGVFVDVKSIYDRTSIESAGYRLWRL